MEEALEEQRHFWEKQAMAIQEDHSSVEEDIRGLIQGMDGKVKKLILGDVKESVGDILKVVEPIEVNPKAAKFKTFIKPFFTNDGPQ